MGTIVTNALNGELDSCSNFYDWFCKDSSLEGKAKTLLKKVEFLVNQGLINPDKTEVWFKNNCPIDGSLYDDIRFNDIDGNYLGGICPRSGHKVKEKCSIWFVNPYSNKTILNWNEFKKEVKNNEMFREEIKNRFYKE